MSENRILFSDDTESDCLEFNSASEAAISISGPRGDLLVGEAPNYTGILNSISLILVR